MWHVVTSVTGRLCKEFNNATSIMPLSLLLLYLINAFEMGFPVTAFRAFLLLDVQMSQSVLSQFYALTFLPWSLKPLYSYIADRFPINGEHRRPYIIMCSVGAAAMYLVTALFVKSTPAVFGVVFVRQIFNAFSEILLGMTLVDLAKDDVTLAAKLQALATSSRVLGSGLAYLLALPMYGCGAKHHDSAPPRVVIGITAAFPLVAALCALTMHKDATATPHDDDHAVADYEAFDANGEAEQSDEISIQGDDDDAPVETSSPFSTVSVVCGILVVQWFMIWISMQSMVPHDTWVALLSTSIVLVACVAVAMFLRRRYSGNVMSRSDAATLQYDLTVLFLPLFFLFLLNGTPSSGVTWSSYVFYLFQDNLCITQLLLLAGTVSNLIACAIYPRVFGRFRSMYVLAAAVVVVGVLSCVQIPLANVWDQDDKTVWGLSPETFIFLASFVADIGGKVFFLAVQVYATEKCCQLPKRDGKSLTSGVMYGIYLSFINFGDSLSGWITAPIIAGLGIEFGSSTIPANWGGLPALIIIGAVSKLAVTLVFVPLVERYTKTPVETPNKPFESLSQVDELADQFEPLQSTAQQAS